MSELPHNESERAPPDDSPGASGSPATQMTTLTLSAGLPETAERTERRPAESTHPQMASAETPLREVPVGELDDHGLIAATRTGDELAFQELVRRYRNPITNFVYRMLNDYDRAVDLTQETFVRVYMNVEKYQANYSFSTYIYRIASNLAISELRQRKRRRMIPFPTFFSDKENSEVEVELPDLKQTGAEESMILDERQEAVRRAIGSLPEKYRTVVVLRDIEGKSYEEISAVLELSDGTVKSRINRARNLLKEKLKDYV